MFFRINYLWSCCCWAGTDRHWGSSVGRTTTGTYLAVIGSASFPPIAAAVAEARPGTRNSAAGRITKVGSSASTLTSSSIHLDIHRHCCISCLGCGC